MNPRDTTTAAGRLRWLGSWRVWLMVLLLSAVATGTYFYTRPDPPPVQSRPVRRGDIVQTVPAAGMLHAKARVDVSTRASGEIKEVAVVLGQNVKKGQLLLVLDPALALSEVVSERARLAQQQARLEISRVELASAKRELARQQRLANQEAAPLIEVEKAQDTVSKIEAGIRSENADLAQQQARLDSSLLNLGYTRIVAPMDGTVVSLMAQVGQTVLSVQTTVPLLTLASLDTMVVSAKVPEAEVQSIKPGQKASFSTLSGSGRRYEGRLLVIQPIPERAEGAVFYNALFEVDNHDRSLFSDMTVQVNIETGSARDVLLAPIIALGEREPGQSGGPDLYPVQVLDAKGQPTRRLVRIGLRDARQVQIVSGLAAGERVLLAPMPAQDTDVEP